MSTRTPITVAYGDGIGPEIMAATLRILNAAGAQLDIETIEIGEKVYLRGVKDGIEPKAWDSLLRTRVFLKAPITTPQGGGYKSLNVTCRKALGLYANVRPCISYAPYIATAHPKMDVVIVRENEEDLYAGIEHRQTQDVYQCLKLITRPGCERIIRYAFEYARENNRKRVSLFVKDNIMKMTDGIMHKVFDEISRQYPDIENDHYIIDIGAARLADTPEIFDVIVTLNLYGDIISDIAAQIAGSVGLAGTSNIGNSCSMFEAIHGSAPTIAGQDIANPSGLILASVMMLVHIGQHNIASLVHNAWLKTIEDGIHTADIKDTHTFGKKVGTHEFANCVIDRLGQKPLVFAELDYKPAEAPASSYVPVASIQVEQNKELMGVDVFIDSAKVRPQVLGDSLKAFEAPEFPLAFISNRGIKVYPGGLAETVCSDHWRVRFLSSNNPVTHRQILELLTRITEAGYDVIKTENLYHFDSQPGFSGSH
jgi:isocitrate dehydrogenase